MRRPHPVGSSRIGSWLDRLEPIPALGIGVLTAEARLSSLTDAAPAGRGTVMSGRGCASVRLRVIGIKLESGVCQDSANFARDALTRIDPDYRASEGRRRVVAVSRTSDAGAGFTRREPERVRTGERAGRPG